MKIFLAVYILAEALQCNTDTRSWRHDARPYSLFFSLDNLL